MTWVSGGDPARLARFADLAVRHVAGEVLVDPELTAAALVVPPGGPVAGPRAQLALLPGLVRSAGLRRLPRVIRGLVRLERAHPPESHATLIALGVEPEHQAQGRGAALLLAVERHLGARCLPRDRVAAHPRRAPPPRLPDARRGPPPRGRAAAVDDGRSRPRLTIRGVAYCRARVEPRRPVELYIPARTLIKLAIFGVLVALAIIALDVLLSIFVAIVLALGLDPVVGSLVDARLEARARRARGLRGAVRRGRADRPRSRSGRCGTRSTEFVAEIPGYWQQISSSDAFQTFISSGSQEKVKTALEDLAKGLPDAASTLLGIAGGIFGSVLSMVTLTFLALFMLIERHTITEWLFDLAPPAVQKRWHPVLEESISGGLLVADRQPGDLARRRHGGGRLGVDLRAAVPDRARGHDRLPGPDPPGRGHARGRDPRARRADRQHAGGDRHGRDPADLPAARELRRLPARLPPRRSSCRRSPRSSRCSWRARSSACSARSSPCRSRRSSRSPCARPPARGASGWRRCKVDPTISP